MWIDDRSGVYWRRQSSWWERQAPNGQWQRDVPENPLRHLSVNPEQASQVRIVHIAGFTLWRGTQAQFDAVPFKDPSTVYVIV